MNETLLPFSWTQSRRNGLLLFLFFSLFLSGGAFAQTNAYAAAGLPVPTVKSDKDDYAPGEVAIITGTGWTKDTQVDVHFEETPAYHLEHQHDFHGVVVDAMGNWRIEYPIELRHLGVAFDVSVVGKQTGYLALTHFTDDVALSVGGNSSLPISLNISADKAADAVTPAYTLIGTTANGSVRISEGPGNGNRGNISTNVTQLVLTAQNGWEFQQSGVSASGTSSDITSFGTISYTPRTITIPVKVIGTSTSDIIIINNVNIRPVNGNTIPNTGTITLSFNGSIAGATSPTSLASITQTAGVPSKLAFVQQPSNAHTGVAISPALTTQVQDQFGNSVSGTRTVGLTINNSGALGGTTSVSTSSSGLATFNNITVSPAGSYNLTASVTGSPSLTNALSNPFIISNLCNAPTITTLTSGQPVHQAKTYGDNATFTINATGVESYQWQVGTGSPIVWSNISNNDIYSGVTTSTLTLAKPGVEMSGRKYRVVLSACTPSQTTTSDAADLIVTPQNLRATSLVASKEYNGSPAPGTVSLGAVTGMVGTETLTITPQASNFSDANVGSAKATTITYILADGANGGKASNYAMAPFATTGEINPKPVLVTPIPNQSKVYGTPEPTFTFGNNAGLGESAFGTTKLARTPGEDVNTYSYSLGNLSAGTNYSLSLDGSNKFAITAKDITGTFASANKIYDGNPDAAATNRQLIGVIGSDAVTLNGGTATFADKNVGEAKTVTLSDATLAGAAAGNYRLATVNSTSASIGAKSLTAASTVASKVYNGSAAAGSVTLGTVSGLVDSETLAIIPTASNYVDANVGTTKATSISYTLANGTNGGLAANYSMAPLAASGEITAKQVTVVPNALTKVYGEEDQAFTYTLSEQPLAGITLSGALGREPGNNVGTYAYTLGSLSAGINYSLNLTNASPLATFAITAKEVSASFTADNKEYDGNATAVVLTRALAGVLSADASNVSLGTSGTASFASAAAGNGKTVTATGLTLTGPAAGNYRLATATATTTANITPKAITVTPIAGQTKVYGAADPTFTYTASESLLTGNSFSGNLAREAGAGVGQYAYTLGSLTAGTNYSLSLLGGGNKFAITAKEVTGSFLAASKTYDGTADATVTARSLGGLVGSDAVTLTGGTAAFADKNVGTGKTVTLTGAALAGAAAGNYTLAAVNTATANITAKDITGTFASATKVYDGNTNAAASNRQLVGVEGTDAVTLSGGTAAFSDKNVASGKTVTLSGAALAGVQAANYRLTSVATALADITSKDLVISISAQDKVYDGNASAVVSASITNGLVTGDKVTVSASNGLFNDKNAGTAKGISATVSKSGDDAGNYLANATASTSATINQKALTASSTVASKVYDGSAATGTVSLGVVTGLVNSETLVITPVAANFENANVGAAKATSISYVLANGTEGGLAANYSMASIAASGAITAKLISGSFTASDKVYDGLANAMVTGRSLNGVIPTDAASVSLTGGSAAFSDKNVANNKTVTLTGASLAGTGVGNYSLTSIATTTATITTRDLMVNATGKDKVYDGTTTATATLNDNRVAGDALNIGYASASFSDPTVGTNKAVVINGIAITGGADAGNYTLPNPTTSTTAQITKASTTTTLVTSAGQVRFMDNLTMTAKITPLNTGSALTGSVEFKIGSVIYGTVAVVPVPGSSDGSVQATLIKQVAELPSNYNLTATFSATNSNYSGSNGSKALTVTPRDASARDVNAGFYTGDVFAWTTSSTSSKATVTLIASLKDVNTPTGDLRAAKVTFYYVNGTTLTPIPSAKDLPVGLVDVNDGSVGFATATVQFDIGSNNAMDYQVAVGVSGAYTNQPSTAQAIITVSKPVPGGFIVGGSQMTNKNSNGYLKGQEGMNTDYQFDIQYTKSGTSPKGKAKVMIRSYYKPDGTLDSKLHTYLITTNAIATLNITKAPDGSATGNFSAKANIVEQLDDLSIVAIEGGSTFQMEAYQRNCDQQVAITLFRKAGGIWFSSNWTGSNTVKQQVNATSKVFVEGGGTMACSTPTTPVATTSKAVIATAPEKAAKAEPKLTSYPNPLTDEATVEFSVTQNEEYSLDVYDMKGALVKHLQKGKAGSSETITATWNARTSNVGVYIIRLSTSNKVKTLRVMRQ